MKALNNMVSAAGLWVAAEAVRVGEAFGLEPGTIVDILNASTGRNNSTENKLKQHMLSRRFASGFSLGLMAKDLAAAASLADATAIERAAAASLRASSGAKPRANSAAPRTTPRS